MKLSRAALFIAVVAASAVLAQAARAGTVCPDDPERCVERGASVPRTAGVVVSAPHTVAVPVTAGIVGAHRTVSPARKQVTKPVRVTPRVTTPAPATPGMGMLLKMSGGTGGDVTWFPSRPVDNSNASWVL